MELKLKTAWSCCGRAESSNRTFMELKSESNAEKIVKDGVLIVPLWN